MIRILALTLIVKIIIVACVQLGRNCIPHTATANMAECGITSLIV